MPPSESQRSDTNTPNNAGFFAKLSAIDVNRWMRLRPKLYSILVLFFIPLGVAVYQVSSARNEAIEFAEKERIGTEFLEKYTVLLGDIASFRWEYNRSYLLQIAQNAEQKEEQIKRLTGLHQKIGKDLQELQDTWPTYEKALLFDPTSLSDRNRSGIGLPALQEQWNLLEKEINEGFYAEAVDYGLVKLIETTNNTVLHAGDTSNLILDPDLDSYYLMDLAMIAIPNLSMRTQNTVISLLQKSHNGDLSGPERDQIIAAKSFLLDVDVARIHVDFQTAAHEDSHFYGTDTELHAALPTIIDSSKVSAQNLADSIDAVVQSNGKIEPEHLHRVFAIAWAAQYVAQKESIEALDRLLVARIQGITQQKYIEMALSLLFGTVVALFAAITIGRLTKRVQSLNQQMQSMDPSDTKARLQVEGHDEITELCSAFNLKADAVEKLYAQIQDQSRNITDILDYVVFGFLVVDRAGIVQAGYTNSCHKLLEFAIAENDAKSSNKNQNKNQNKHQNKNPMAGQKLARILGLPEKKAIELDMAFDAIYDDILPEELLIEQIPKRFVRESGRVLYIEGRVIRNEEGAVHKILLTVSDVTELEAARKKGDQNKILVDILRKKGAFISFLKDTRMRLDNSIVGIRNNNSSLVRREIHTIKGNAGAYGLSDLVDIIHEIEAKEKIYENHIEEVRAVVRHFLEENGDVLEVRYETADAPIYPLRGEHFLQLEQMATTFLQESQQKLAETHPAAYQDDRAFIYTVKRWVAERRLQPAGDMLGPVREFVSRISERLEKEVSFKIEGDEIRVSCPSFEPIAQNIPHLLRNALDHGIEPNGLRVGKPSAGRMYLKVKDVGNFYVAIVADDGRGINTDALVKKAIEKGFYTRQQCNQMTELERQQLIFLDGVSTATVVTELSGRGVGMAAVQAAVEQVNGKIHVWSERDVGTQFTIVWPKPAILCLDADALQSVNDNDENTHDGTGTGANDNQIREDLLLIDSNTQSRSHTIDREIDEIVRRYGVLA